MAKILYGVCGEGLGHASRSRILVNYLKKQNHEVRIVAIKPVKKTETMFLFLPIWIFI